MGWRERLLDAADATGRSDREISLACKLGPNFLNEIRTTAKVPSVDRLLKLADEIGLSRAKLFLGMDISPQDEEFLRLLGDAGEDARKGLVALLQGRRRPAKTE